MGIRRNERQDRIQSRILSEIDGDSLAQSALVPLGRLIVRIEKPANAMVRKTNKSSRIGKAWRRRARDRDGHIE